MFISVIIPTYKDWNRLALCIDALERQSFPPLGFEVIIVNNDPSGNIPVDLCVPDNVLIINEPKTGSYAARNAGITKSKGGILAFTDSDCIPDKNWIVNALAHFSDDSIALIGGKVNIFKDKDASNLVYTYEKYTSFRQEINVPKGNGITANLFVRKEIALQVGMFNSHINSGGDRDFTRRCVSTGHRMVYAENVIVYHPARKTLKDLLQKEKRIASWDIINTHKKTGRSKFRIIGQQLKNGIVKINKQQKRAANIEDKLSVIYVGFVRLSYRLLIGLFVLFKVIDFRQVR